MTKLGGIYSNKGKFCIKRHGKYMADQISHLTKTEQNILRMTEMECREKDI